MLFVMSVVADGKAIIGVVENKDLNAWKTSGKKIEITNPRELRLIPMNENAVQVTPMPIFPVKLKQTTMIFEPTIINIISEMTWEDETETWNVDQGQELYTAYVDSVRDWDAEIAGIVVPQGNMDNVTQFPGGQK